MSSPSKRREMDLMKLYFIPTHPVLLLSGCSRVGSFLVFFFWEKRISFFVLHSLNGFGWCGDRMMSDYKVEMINDGMQEFYVDFHGPKDSPYQGGLWRIRVELPDAYPYKSPSIGFINKIYHPNVDEMSGSVCLDVINQTWSPMFDLVNVFEVFLPQLLLYPNPSDPLNGEAAALMMRDKASYEQRVKEYCEKYAKPEDIGAAEEDKSSDEELSDEEDYESSDEAMPGHPDP
ncbi:hypothetical protein SAY86_021639 [Trapa natans]|uniref:E2 ubiquitin-conjugating enzyme n=1 Tax=Trapa natans TaxID=22666 RepID=A0AAN7REY0_TRANT|nr:hypothetical protein SAY86_021639 [Trapa natans]